jgi:photosystem II stability/assembly factor-like uncharacterized protein
MFHSIRVLTLSLVASLLAFASLVIGQDNRVTKPLTEADLVALIGRQADEQAILGRIAKHKIAFTMDAATLARLKMANPSTPILDALTKFLPTEGAVKSKVVTGKGMWKLQESGVKEFLRDVAFVDEKIGVAVGDNGVILRTTDSGNSWQPIRQTKPGERRHDFGKVMFSGPKEGWIITNICNAILHTVDAGATWTNVKLPGRDDVYGLAGAHNCCQAASGSRYYYLCWGLSGSHLYQTEDAGRSWKELTNKISVAGAGLSIPDGKHGVFAARMGIPTSGHIGTTSDGGATWQVQKERNDKLHRGNYANVQMIDKDRGWYLPHVGTIHATTDGGKSWTPQELGHVSTSALLALHFLDAQRGHVLCGAYPGEVRRTIDGGKSWQSLGKLGNPSHLSGMSFPSMNHGWVVGEKGYIEHYSGESTATPEGR